MNTSFEVRQRVIPVAVKSNDWKVEFEIKPGININVDGRKPSLDEFRNAFYATPFPLAAIDALYVSACVAFDNKERMQWR